MDIEINLQPMNQHGETGRPWFAIGWFVFWGLFQGFVVFSVLNGTWERPPAFPQEAYESLIYPDMFFIPIYFLAATLLYGRHWLGSVTAFVAGGGLIYVMIYLLALGFSGIDNVIMDGIFLVCTLVSLWQVAHRMRTNRA